MSTDVVISLITLAGVVVGVIVVSIQLGRWGGRLERRIDTVDQRIDVLNAWASGFSREMNTFLGLIVNLLHNRQALDNDEMGKVAQAFSNLSNPAVNALFAKERRSRNPLTPEELQRLEGYVYRARAGQWLTEDEVRDYNQLVSVLEREKPTDPGVWPLVALGAFLHGLVVGSSGQRRS